jgi:hypothetical protein
MEGLNEAMKAEVQREILPQTQIFLEGRELTFPPWITTPPISHRVHICIPRLLRQKITGTIEPQNGPGKDSKNFLLGRTEN